MSDWVKIISVAALSVAVSIGGVLIAVFVTHCKEDALRGGALGTALALIFMFIARNYGMKLYDEAKKLTDMEREARRAEATPENDSERSPHAPLTIDEVSQRIETLRSAIVVDGDELKKLNWFLIGATAVAAIVCAFGDKIAGHYLPPHSCQ
jgi:hypothetical protein